MNAAIKHTGTVTAGISAARALPRNSQITISTKAIASNSVFQTCVTAASINTVESKATKMREPSGSVFWIFSASARAARATSRLFAVEVLMMPRPTLGTPLLRK